jgi:hypothetical protein
MHRLPHTDPIHAAALRGGARILDQHAAALRTRAVSLASTSAQVRWFSSAATCFRREIELVTADFRRAAGGVEHAATTLRAHASAVEQLEAAGAGLLLSVSGAIGHYVADARTVLNPLAR